MLRCNITCALQQGITTMAYSNGARVRPPNANRPAPSPYRHCQWPFGDPQEEDFRYCGAPTLAPHSYCRIHAQMAYRDPDEEREAETPTRAAA